MPLPAVIDTPTLSANSAEAVRNLHNLENAFGRVDQAQIRARAGINRTGKAFTTFSNLLTPTTVALLGLGFGLFDAVKKFAQFERAITNAGTVTGLFGKELDAAKEVMAAAAMEMGRGIYNSLEVAEAFYQLNSAGLAVTESTAVMAHVLNLATATLTDVKSSGELLTSTMRAFGIEADNTRVIADVFAKAIGQSPLNMNRLAESMKYVASVGSVMGRDIAEVTAALGIMARRGFYGSIAGTALRNVFVRLTRKTSDVRNALERLGLTYADVNPATQSLASVLGKLEEAGARTSDIMEIMGVRAGPAFLALMQEGSEGVREFTATIRASGGAAETMANEQLDTLWGQMKRLGSQVTNLSNLIGNNLYNTFKNYNTIIITSIALTTAWTLAVQRSYVAMTGGVAITSRLAHSIGMIGAKARVAKEALKGLFLGGAAAQFHPRTGTRLLTDFGVGAAVAPIPPTFDRSAMRWRGATGQFVAAGGPPSKLAGVWAGLKGSLAGVTGGLSTVGLALGGVTAIAAAGAIAWHLYQRRLKRARAAMQETGEELRKMADAFIAEEDAEVKASKQSVFEKKARELKDAIDDANKVLDKSRAWRLFRPGQVAEAKMALAEYREAWKMTGEALDTAGYELRRNGEIIKKVTDDVEDAVYDLKQALEDLNASFKGAGSLLSNLGGLGFSIESAMRMAGPELRNIQDILREMAAEVDDDLGADVMDQFREALIITGSMGENALKNTGKLVTDLGSALDAIYERKGQIGTEAALQEVSNVLAQLLQGFEDFEVKEGVTFYKIFGFDQRKAADIEKLIEEILGKGGISPDEIAQNMLISTPETARAFWEAFFGGKEAFDAALAQHGGWFDEWAKAFAEEHGINMDDIINPPSGEWTSAMIKRWVEEMSNGLDSEEAQALVQKFQDFYTDLGITSEEAAVKGIPPMSRITEEDLTRGKPMFEIMAKEGYQPRGARPEGFEAGPSVYESQASMVAGGYVPGGMYGGNIYGVGITEPPEAGGGVTWGVERQGAMRGEGVQPPPIEKVETHINITNEGGELTPENAEEIEQIVEQAVAEAIETHTGGRGHWARVPEE
jgi:TP901 family phage tail tape measure protein